MTDEQEKLKADLLAEYGEPIVAQASELSGLALCMAGLGNDELTPAERARLYQQGRLHLGRLLETVMPPEVSAKVTECARRMDDAIALWAVDGMEQAAVEQAARAASGDERYHVVRCPKCDKPFTGTFLGKSRVIVLTPCCGWVGLGKVPAWARATHERATRKPA